MDDDDDVVVLSAHADALPVYIMLAISAAALVLSLLSFLVDVASGRHACRVLLDGIAARHDATFTGPPSVRRPKPPPPPPPPQQQPQQSSQTHDLQKHDHDHDHDDEQRDASLVDGVAEPDQAMNNRHHRTHCTRTTNITSTREEEDVRLQDGNSSSCGSNRRVYRTLRVTYRPLRLHDPCHALYENKMRRVRVKCTLTYVGGYQTRGEAHSELVAIYVCSVFLKPIAVP